MPAKLLTIDGPAGSGKSTVARALARELRGLVFSTGRLYRAVTLLALEAGLLLGEENTIDQVLNLLPRSIALGPRGGEIRPLVEGRDPGRALFTSRVTAHIHWIADETKIRAQLRPIQRRVVDGIDGVVVAEGRDLGTIVFPDAPVKVFLTATLEERARRRWLEVRSRESGAEGVEVATVMAELARRDRYDEERSAAPLRAPEGARIVDSTNLTTEEVVASIRKGIPDDWVQDDAG